MVDDFAAGILATATDEGLTVPGSSMAYKLYVVLNTGNEKGSNTVTVTHEP